MLDNLTVTFYGLYYVYVHHIKLKPLKFPLLILDKTRNLFILKNSVNHPACNSSSVQGGWFPQVQGLFLKNYIWICFHRRVFFVFCISNFNKLGNWEILLVGSMPANKTSMLLMFIVMCSNVFRNFPTSFYVHLWQLVETNCRKAFNFTVIKTITIQIHLDLKRKLT